MVKLTDLIKMYKKHLTVKNAIRLCAGYLEVQWIKGIPYIGVNKPLKNPPHRNVLKFQYFCEQVNISPGDVQVDKQTLYNYYDTWVYTTRKRRPLTEIEFNKMCKKSFKREYRNFYINREITIKEDVATWRKQRAKKEKA